MKVQLLELLHLDTSDGSAEKIYATFKNYMDSKHIPISSIVGLACDGAAVMIGNNNSFYSRLKKDVPHIILLKCVCHSAALISSKACNMLPRECEDLLRNTYSYIGSSSKRCVQLKEMQSYFELNHYKILKLSGTRWLATHQCIERILVNWDVLIAYFGIAVYEDDLNSAKVILEKLQDPRIKCYFLFLKYSLNYMNQFNALFQSQNSLIDILKKESVKLFLQISQNFLKPSVLKEEYLNCNILHPSNYLPNDQIFVGAECEALLSTLDILIQNDFKRNILKFYITICEEMMTRLPLKNKLFSEFEFITKVAFETTKSNVLNSLSSISDVYKGIIDITALNYEWRILPYHFNSDEREKLIQLDKVKMWLELEKIQDFAGKFLFKNIAKIALIVLTLPHSNAAAERIFSMMNDIKTKKRNKLSASSLNAVCVIRSSFSLQNINCFNFEPNDCYYNYFTTNMYKE